MKPHKLIEQAEKRKKEFLDDPIWRAHWNGRRHGCKAMQEACLKENMNYKKINEKLHERINQLENINQRLYREVRELKKRIKGK